MANAKPLLIGEKTTNEWDRSWIKVPRGLTQIQTKL